MNSNISNDYARIWPSADIAEVSNVSTTIFHCGILSKIYFHQLIKMQISTIIGLAGTVTCVGLFIKQKNWLLATAFAFSTVYMILDKVIHIPMVPYFLVPWFAYLFFALVAYEFFRTVVLK